MHDPTKFLVTTEDLAMVIAGAAIAYASAKAHLDRMEQVDDPRLILTLVANALHVLGNDAPETRTQSVFAQISEVLMRTEIGA